MPKAQEPTFDDNLLDLQNQVAALGPINVQGRRTQPIGPPTNDQVTDFLSKNQFNWDSVTGKYVLGPIAQGLVGDFGGLMMRSGVLGDATEEDRQALGMATEAIGQSAARTDSSDPYLAMAQRGVRGALRSASSTAPAAIVGTLAPPIAPYLAIGLGGATAGEQAYTEAIEKGYDKPLLHAVVQGGSEILIAGILQKMGLGGAENYYGPAGRAFVKEGVKNVKTALAKRIGKDLLAELGEEELTTIVQQMSTPTAIDQKAGKWTHDDGSIGWQVGKDGKQHLPPMWEAIADTAAQTIFQTTGTAAGRKVVNMGIGATQAAAEKTKAVFGGRKEAPAEQPQQQQDFDAVKRAFAVGTNPTLANGKSPGKVIGYEDGKIVVRDGRGLEKVIAPQALSPEFTPYEHTREFAHRWAHENPELAQKLFDASQAKGSTAISDFESVKLDRRGVSVEQRNEFAGWLGEVVLPSRKAAQLDEDVQQWVSKTPEERRAEENRQPTKEVSAVGPAPAKDTQFAQGDFVTVDGNTNAVVIGQEGGFVTVDMPGVGQTTVRRKRITGYRARGTPQQPVAPQAPFGPPAASEVPGSEVNQPVDKPQFGASMPVMITKKMRKRLVQLGYNENQIRNMTPESAQLAIQKGRKGVPAQPKQGLPETAEFGKQADTVDYDPQDIIDGGRNVGGLAEAAPDVQWTDSPDPAKVEASIPMDRGGGLDSAGNVIPAEATPPNVQWSDDGTQPQPQASDTPPVGPQGDAELPPTEQTELAHNLAARLSLGIPLETAEFWAMADAAFGGTRGEGAYGDSEAYDALELAINLLAQGDTDPTVDAAKAKAETAKLREMISNVPSQTNRTGEKETFQQFSTPPDYAYAVAWVANLTPNDIVLEPSAGTGSIATQALNSGATVYGNELTDNRARLLAEVIGPEHVFTEDAKNIGSILYDRMPAPTVVLMNPPFSTDGKNFPGVKQPGADLKHIDEALQLLADNGRLIAIIGAPLHEEKGETRRFQDWFNEVAKEYNVRAHVKMARGVYKGYGTTFPTRVLVIDKNGPTKQPPLGGKAESVEALIDLLEAVRNERGEQAQQQPAQPGSAEGAQDAGGGTDTGTTSRPDAGAMGGGKQPRSEGQPDADGGGRRSDSGGTERGGPTDGSIRTDGERGDDGGRQGGLGDRDGRGATEGSTDAGSQGELAGGERAGEGPAANAGGPGLTAAEIADLARKKIAEMQAKKKEAEAKAEKKPETPAPTGFGAPKPPQAPPAAPPSANPPAAPSGPTLSPEMQAQAERIRQLLSGRGGKLPKNLGPDTSAMAGEFNQELLDALSDFTGSAIAEMNKTDFGDYVRLLDDVFGRDNVMEMAEYAEQVWDYLRTVIPTLSPVGSVAAVLGTVAPPAPKPPQAPPNRAPRSGGKGTTTQSGKTESKPQQEETTETQKDVGEVGASNVERKGPEELTDSIYEPYQPSKLSVPGAKPHPGSLAESAAMAAVDAPNITYKISIPQEQVENGTWSAAQLEQIYYAGQAHEKMLPGEKGKPDYRQGYAIGDGTGVGKGREIAGIIIDNFNKGRKKAVWITKNKDLYADATRDWTAVGRKESELIKPPAMGQKIKGDTGVVLMTYATLKSVSQEKEKGDRLKQLVEWLGADFDGVIAFDEAHSMAGAVDSDADGPLGGTSASQTAITGLQLQKLLPKARIVYVSATMATEVRNLGYMPRLGLWGKGTPFADVKDFIAKITHGGVAAMELVARDLKAMGKYLARSLSFNDGTPEGTVRYDKLEHKLTPEQKEQYNRVAEGWRVVLENIEKALGITKANRAAATAAMSAFWGAQLRFYNQYLMTMQMPSVISSIEKDLKDPKGKSVVLQLVNTEEAAQDRQLAKRTKGDEDYDEFSVSPMDTLLQMIDKSFPTEKYEDKPGPTPGTIVREPVLDSKGNAVHDPRALKMKKQLMEDIESIGSSVGESPLDLLINHFGIDAVAEITGRKTRIVRGIDDQGVERKMRFDRKGDDTTKADAAAFNAGQKRILIFSEKGGTGSSYHASREIPNQQERVHYLLQPGWKAMTAVQGFGRTHRTNQKQAPQYILVSTDLAGHKRFLSTIARRLSQLGALTKGQRQTGFGGSAKEAMFTEADNLESREAGESLAAFFRAMNAGLTKMSLAEFERATAINMRDARTGQMKARPPHISKVLNRILIMPVDEQNEFFNEFFEFHSERVAREAAAGNLDRGVENIKAIKVEKLTDVPVRTDPSGAVTRYVKLRVHQENHPDTWQMVQWYEPLRYVMYKGRLYAVIESRNTTTDLKTGKVKETYRFISPQGGQSRYHEADKVNGHPDEFKEVDATKAEQIWNKELAEAPKIVTHEQHMIVGLILPVWDKLKGSVTVRRALTDKGEQLLGRIIPPTQVAATLTALGVSDTGESTRPNLTPQQAIAAVLDDNLVLRLDNGWIVKRSNVGREDRIEVIGPAFGTDKAFEDMGGFKSKIASKVRYFVPIGEKSVNVMTSLLDAHPIANVTKGKVKNDDESAMKAPEFGARKEDDRDDYDVAPDTSAMAAPSSTTTPTPGTTRKIGPYSDLKIPARMEDSEGPVQSAHEVIATMGKLFNVPIRKGRIKTRDALGIYKRLSRVIRFQSQADADLAVAAHEVAHHIDFTMLPRGKRNALITSSMKDELRGLDYDVRRGNIPHHEGRLHEGFAEFMRLYWTDTDEAKAQAPEFFEYMTEGWLKMPAQKKVAESIDKIKRMIDRWKEQGSKKRVDSAISESGYQDGPRESWKERVPAGLRDGWNRMYARWKDKAHAVALYDKAVREAGKDVAPGNSAYGTMLAYDQAGPSAAARAIDDGVFSVTTGKRLSKGLREILKDITPSEYNEFRRFLYARHAQEVWQKGRIRQDGRRVMVNPGITAQDANQIVGEIMSDPERAQRFTDAADGVTHFNNSLLDMLVDAGVIGASSARAMKDRWETYVPLFRARPKGEKAFGGFGGKLVDLPGAVRARYGSGLQILDPIESTIQQAAMFYDRAYKQQVILRMVEEGDPQYSGAQGMGDWIEHVDPKTQTIAVNLKEVWPAIVKRLEELGIEDMGVDIDELAEMGDLMVQDFTNIYRLDFSPDPKRNIVRTVIRGQPRLYWVNKDLYEAVTNMNAVKVPSFMRILSSINRVRRLGATGLNTIFAAANVPRDWVTFQFQTRHSRVLESLYTPFKWMGIFAKAEMVRLGILDGETDEAVKLWKELGGQLSTKLGLDRPGLSRARKDVVAHTKVQHLKDALWHPLDTFRDIISISDVGPRLAEFVGVLRERGYERRKVKGRWQIVNVKNGKVERPPQDVLIEAINAANDVTVNFKRMGSTGRVMNEFYLFFNAGLESIDKTGRTLKAAMQGDERSVKRVTIAMASMMASSLLYWLMRHDDDDYEEQEEWLKNSAWTFAVDGTPVIRIPKPYEWGFVANFIESTANSLDDKSLKPFVESLDQQMKKMIPLWDGPEGFSGVTGALEAFFNYDFFREQPIDSDKMMRLKPWARSTEQTTWLAKAIGELTNKSPNRIEHVLNSYTGGGYSRGMNFAEAMGRAAAGEEGAITPREVPFGGAFYVRKDYHSSVNDFYSEFEDARQTYTTAERLDEDGASDELSIRYHTLYDYQELMSKIGKLEPKTRDRDQKFAYEKYEVGLARAALGQEPLDRYPNPLAVPLNSLPDDVAAEVMKHRKKLSDRLTESMPKYKLGESKEAYRRRLRDWRVRRERARQQLQSISAEAQKMKK